MTQQIVSSNLRTSILHVFSWLPSVSVVMAKNVSRYCCDPFKHHRCVHFHLRVASEKLRTEHSDLAVQSGDLFKALSY